MPLYPIPAVIAFVGWTAVFLTSDWPALIYGAVSLIAGLLAFVIWNLTKPKPVELDSQS
jgi:UDP-N-acetylmuramyl pentapeptide phosphotransferase/UDP-N-acetylglucosamine-1-phosphate transferase